MIDWINSVPNDGLIYYTHLFNAERLLVTKPKALAEVLVHKNYDFIKPPQIREGLSRILGGYGVLLAEGEDHKVSYMGGTSMHELCTYLFQTQRKNLMPAFAYRHVKDLYPVFWSKAGEMVKAVTLAVRNEAFKAGPDQAGPPSAIIEINGWASRATLDIIGIAGMGQDFNAINDPNTELYATYQKIFQPSRQAQVLGILSLILPFWLLRILPVKRNEEMLESSKVIRRTCRQLIRQKQAKLDNKEKRVDVDILSVALESGGFTEDNLVDQLMTFLAAGHETTATATAWAMAMLCQHPEVQTRLRQEIRANLPSIDDNTKSVSAQSIDNLPYLHAFCNEVLRFYAPVPMTRREAAKDTSIQGQFVPKGTSVFLSAYAVNLSTELWGPDATKFNPDRWIGPGRANTGGADSNYSFMTFLHGPRSCIGQAFAKGEYACLVAAIVGRFEMEFEHKDHIIEIQGGITARPKGGLNLRMRVLEGW